MVAEFSLVLIHHAGSAPVPLPMTLAVCLDELWKQLHALANDDAWLAFTIEAAFGVDADASHFRVAWFEDDRSSMPAVEVRPAAEINGANGAFSAATGRIYLALEFIEAHVDHPDDITAVLLEEYGHFLDSQINVHDSEGDEGAIFARLVQDKSISQHELQKLKAHEDKAIVALDGQYVEIEQNSSGVAGKDPLAQYTFKRNPDQEDGDQTAVQRVKGARKNDAHYAWQLLS